MQTLRNKLYSISIHQMAKKIKNGKLEGRNL